MTNGLSLLTAKSGASLPASIQTRCRTTALALLMAFNAALGLAATASISRDTVGSDATRPNTPGWARSNARSARQSPPVATLIEPPRVLRRA